MKTQDLFKTKAAKVNESIHKAFGKKIDFSTFDAAKLEDARNKLRTQLHQARSTSEFNENLESDTYHEAQWMLDAINKELEEREEVAIKASDNSIFLDADITVPFNVAEEYFRLSSK